MRIGASSDWHLDATTAGIPRLEDFERYADELFVASQNLDVLMVLGDLFDPGKMNSHELTAFLIRTIARFATMTEVIVIAGNHDVVESSSGVTTLTPLAAAVSIHAGCGLRPIHVIEKPRALKLMNPRDPFDTIGVLALPYVARAAHNEEDLSTALADAKKLRADGFPIVVIGHRMVPGAVIGSESREMARGRDVDLPIESLEELSPALVMNGHYHRAQVVECGDLRVHIPGSPSRFTFGERDDKRKGFIVTEISGA